VLVDAVTAKFSQHEDLKKELLATGSGNLLFQSKDPYEGVGGDGRGKNFLGQALMQLRASWQGKHEI
jgi:hypothetical protein